MGFPLLSPDSAISIDAEGVCREGLICRWLFNFAIFQFSKCWWVFEGDFKRDARKKAAFAILGDSNI